MRARSEPRREGGASGQGPYTMRSENLGRKYHGRIHYLQDPPQQL